MKHRAATRSTTLAAAVLGTLLSAAPPTVERTAAQEQPRPLSKAFSVIDSHSEAETVTVPLYKSTILQLNQPIRKISIGNDEIADILILRSRQLYIQGKDLGSTNVLLWDTNDRLIASLNVEVTHDLNSLKAKLNELLPNEKIQVRSSQGTLVLSGQVSSLANMDSAVQVARGFSAKSGGKEEDKDEQARASVVNLLSVGGAQQVMLKVTVAEMARSVAKKLGFQFNSIGLDGNWSIGGVNGGATFPDALYEPNDVRIPVFSKPPVIGPVIDEFMPNPQVIEDTGLFASFLNSNFLFNAALEASKENNSTRILAEPTLTTLTGQEAKFLSGGEFPIPVPRGDLGVTIQFKEFGVGLSFVPVVLNSGRINMKINVSVSELVSANSVILQGDSTVSQLFIPALTKRDAFSTVELSDGQTIGIAGLISEETRDLVNKFPGLGDIPVLGHLFRSSEFEQGETELVILVTPHLAKPIDRNAISLPTDNFVAPSDVDFYLLGRNRGREQTAALRTSLATSSNAAEYALPSDAGGVEASFGHALDDK